MDADLKRTIKINLVIFAVVAVAWIGYIVYSRRDTGAGPKKPETTYSSNMDDYVTPKKIFPYNLDSAKKELVGKPVWVKTGNVLPYYPYNAATHSVNFKRQVGLLPPLAKFQVKDIVLQRAPVSLKPGEIAVIQKQIMAVFEESGERGTYAASFGTNTGDNYTFIANDIFFFDDPHQLYKHWPSETWSAIEQHQAKQGMSELQATFALGTNMSADSGEYGNRTVEFVNAGKPVTVTFEKNKATTITEGKTP
jgi:hypothetical protein